MTSSTLAYRAIGKETAAIAAAGVVLYLGVADSRGRAALLNGASVHDGRVIDEEISYAELEEFLIGDGGLRNCKFLTCLSKAPQEMVAAKSPARAGNTLGTAIICATLHAGGDGNFTIGTTINPLLVPQVTLVE
jgi:hypothetical protein